MIAEGFAMTLHVSLDMLAGPIASLARSQLQRERNLAVDISVTRVRSFGMHALHIYLEK